MTIETYKKKGEKVDSDVQRIAELQRARILSHGSGGCSVTLAPLRLFEEFYDTAQEFQGKYSEDLLQIACREVLSTRATRRGGRFYGDAAVTMGGHLIPPSRACSTQLMHITTQTFNCGVSHHYFSRAREAEQWVAVAYKLSTTCSRLDAETAGRIADGYEEILPVAAAR